MPPSRARRRAPPRAARDARADRRRTPCGRHRPRALARDPAGRVAVERVRRSPPPAPSASRGARSTRSPCAAQPAAIGAAAAPTGARARRRGRARAAAARPRAARRRAASTAAAVDEPRVLGLARRRAHEVHALRHAARARQRLERGLAGWSSTTRSTSSRPAAARANASSIVRAVAAEGGAATSTYGPSHSDSRPALRASRGDAQPVDRARSARVERARSGPRSRERRARGRSATSTRACAAGSARAAAPPPGAAPAHSTSVGRLSRTRCASARRPAASGVEHVDAVAGGALVHEGTAGRRAGSPPSTSPSTAQCGARSAARVLPRVRGCGSGGVHVLDEQDARRVVPTRPRACRRAGAPDAGRGRRLAARTPRRRRGPGSRPAITCATRRAPFRGAGQLRRARGLAGGAGLDATAFRLHPAHPRQEPQSLAHLQIAVQHDRLRRAPAEATSGSGNLGHERRRLRGGGSNAASCATRALKTSSDTFETNDKSMLENAIPRRAESSAAPGCPRVGTRPTSLRAASRRARRRTRAASSGRSRRSRGQSAAGRRRGTAQALPTRPRAAWPCASR